LKKDRVFPDIYLERLGSPSADGLNEVRRDAVLCQRGGTTRSHGLTGNIRVEEELHSTDEEGA
jgi:hypothetical protein